MSSSSSKVNLVSAHDVGDPLCDVPTHSLKSPPESNALPLDRSFLCVETPEWEVKRFVVKCFSTPLSTKEISVDLCEFVNSSPNKFLHQKIDLDERIYLPRHVTLRDKKKASKSVNDMGEPTSVPCYLNNESCISEGYSLMSNGSKGRGLKTDNVYKYYKSPYAVATLGGWREGQLRQNTSKGSPPPLW